MNTQNIYSPELSTFEIIEWRMKTQSVVDFPFWNPNDWANPDFLAHSMGPIEEYVFGIM